MTSPSKSNKKPSVYEMCKEKLKNRKQVQKPQSEINFHNLKVAVTMYQNRVTSNVNSNIIRVFQPCPKHQPKVINEIKGEFLSAPSFQPTPCPNQPKVINEIKREFLPAPSFQPAPCPEHQPKVINEIKEEFLPAPCPKHQPKVINEIKGEFLPAPSFGENSFLNKALVINQLPLEGKTCTEVITGTQPNSCPKHQKLKMPVCSICYAQFENKTELVKHINSTHERKRGRPAIPVKCNFCRKKFTCKKECAIHYRKHSEKTYSCVSCKKMCSLNVSHSCKNIKHNKRKNSVWDACKEVLTEKSRQVSPRNSEFVPKLPISKKDVFAIGPLNKAELKNFPSPVDKMVANSTSFLEKNSINGTYNRINCVQNSIEQLFDKFKDFGNPQSNNLMHIKAEPTDSSKVDSTKFHCNICDASFTEMEKYEAHYSIHLDEVFCQIKEGEEELQVCSICGGCFTETNAFQAHKLTHVDTELSNKKTLSEVCSTIVIKTEY